MYKVLSVTKLLDFAHFWLGEGGPPDSDYLQLTEPYLFLFSTIKGRLSRTQTNVKNVNICDAHFGGEATSDER